MIENVQKHLKSKFDESGAAVQADASQEEEAKINQTNYLTHAQNMIQSMSTI